MTTNSLPPQDEAAQQPTNRELMAKLDQVLDFVRHQGDEIVELRQRLSALEAPPTKTELIEQVRERDSQIAHLKQRIAELEARG